MKHLFVILLLSLTCYGQQSMTTGTIVTSGAGLGASRGQGTVTLQSVSVAPSVASISTGGTQNFTATGNYSDGSTADVTTDCAWSSSNTAVATIGAKGNPQVVNGAGAGTATITCNDSGVIGTATLTVASVVITVVGAPPEATIGVAYSFTFTANGGTPPYTFAESGTIPTGITFSGSTLSGTAANGTAGSYPFTITATDSASNSSAPTPFVLVVVVASAGLPAATLPQTWVNAGETSGTAVCDLPSPCNAGNNCFQKFIHTDGSGDYACTMKGFNQSSDAWATASDQWWEVIVDDAGSTGTGGRCVATGVTIPNSGGDPENTRWRWPAKVVGAGKPTRCLTYHSAHPNTSAQTLCSHGITDSSSRNPGCTNDISHTFGIHSAIVTQPNESGSAINMSGQNANGDGVSHIRLQDAEVTSCAGSTAPSTCVTGSAGGNQYSLIYTASSGSQTGTTGTTSPGTSVTVSNSTGFAVNQNIAIIGAGTAGANYFGSISSMSGAGNTVWTISPATSTSVSAGTAVTNQLQQSAPSEIFIERTYVHSDYNDSAVSPNGSEVITGVIIGCTDCGFLYNYFDNLGVHGESHCYGMTDAINGVKIVGNWIDACNIDIMSGGGASIYPAASGTGWTVPQNVEIRRNRLAYNPNWLALGCISQVVGKKNNGEMKMGIQYLWNGNIYEYSDGCGQDGQLATFDVRAGNTQDNYNAVISDVTFTNNVLRHAGNGILEGGHGGSAGSVSGTRGLIRLTLMNNLLYDIGNNASHSGNTPGYIFRSGAGGGGPWTCPTVARSSNTVTMTCSDAGVGMHQLDIAVGENVTVNGCTDTSLNTTLGSIGPPALAGTNGLSTNGRTVVYANAGSNVSYSSETCKFWNYGGWPNSALWIHNTAIIQGATTRHPNQVGSATVISYPLNAYYRDNLIAVDPSVGWSGWQWGPFGEGNTAEVTWDINTLNANHLTFPGRSSKAHSYLIYPGGTCTGDNATCSTFWFDPAVVCSAATVGASAQPCFGFKGMMSGSAFLLNSSNEFVDYDLVADSPYKAAGSRQASDNTNLGANLTNIQNAQTETTYSGCSGNCGSHGPYPD